MNTCVEQLNRLSAWAIVRPMVALLPILLGCDGISIAPSCPNALRVGETGQLFAEVVNPGSIPMYLWEAIPSEAGVFDNPQAADTIFQALQEGVVTIRLTASDGLFQVISECLINVSGVVGLAVSLDADPVSTAVGEAVTLTCTSVGSTAARELSITQTEGPIVDFVEVEPGVVRFEPERADEYVFRCVGAGRGEQLSTPAFVTVIVFLEEPPPSNGNANENENGNDNGNENGNGDDDGNVNANDNVSNFNGE